MNPRFSNIRNMRNSDKRGGVRCSGKASLPFASARLLINSVLAVHALSGAQGRRPAVSSPSALFANGGAVLETPSSVSPKQTVQPQLRSQDEEPHGGDSSRRNELTFFLVRHGQSKPNVSGEIVSSMEGGIDPANGLTDKGLEQARRAGKELKEVMRQAGCSPANTMVLTSPFSRAKETAHAIRDCLECELREVRDLRERWFGDFDGKDDITSYQKVWALDALSALHAEHGVESARDVAVRAAALVDRIRKEVSVRQRFHTGEGQPFTPGPSAVVLVSHGDALQLLQCFLAGRPLEQHRSLPHLENCGIRVLRPRSDEVGHASSPGKSHEGTDEEGMIAPFRSTGARVFRRGQEAEPGPREDCAASIDGKGSVTDGDLSTSWDDGDLSGR